MPTVLFGRILPAQNSTYLKFLNYAEFMQMSLHLDEVLPLKEESKEETLEAKEEKEHSSVIQISKNVGENQKLRDFHLSL